MKFPYTRALEIRQLHREGKLSREEAKEQLAFILELDDHTDMCLEAQGPGYSYGPQLRPTAAALGCVQCVAAMGRGSQQGRFCNSGHWLH